MNNKLGCFIPALILVSLTASIPLAPRVLAQVAPPATAPTTRPTPRQGRPVVDPSTWSPAHADGPVAAGAKIEKLAEGFSFTEGATSDEAGNVYFVDQPNDRIMLWDTDGKLSVWMHPSGYSNGMCFDGKGNLIACADEKNELWSIAPDKKVTVLLHDYQGKLLNAPNDVWVRPDGGLYFTDPFYDRTWWPADRRGQHTQDANGVYYLSPDRKTLTRVIGDYRQPNGIIGTADGKTLYVSDINAGKTFVYTINDDGSLTDKKPFCDAGSDGMTIDSDGNVYLTVRGSVQIFDKTGKLLETLPVPGANVCFGGKDGQTLFITARERLYSLKMKTKRVGPQ